MRPFLPWERVVWRGRSLTRPATQYALTDFRLFASTRRATVELALQDIGDVEHIRSFADRLLGTSTVVAHARDRRRPSVALRHVRHGARLAATIDLLVHDPACDLSAVRAALAWNPSPGGRRWRELAAGIAVVATALLAVTTGVQSSTPSVAYPADDAIRPNGVKRDRDAIVRYMETVVMPWARVALGPLEGGADQITCATCHGSEPTERGWQMPAVAALPEPLVRRLGWETYSSGMDAQLRNAIYGYLAEADNQARAAYMRRVVLPGMARLLHRPMYDFTRSYEYNRRRAAFGCYHCHRVK